MKKARDCKSGWGQLSSPEAKNDGRQTGKRQLTTYNSVRPKRSKKPWNRQIDGDRLAQQGKRGEGNRHVKIHTMGKKRRTVHASLDGTSGGLKGVKWPIGGQLRPTSASNPPPTPPRPPSPRTRPPSSRTSARPTTSAVPPHPRPPSPPTSHSPKGAAYDSLGREP